MFFGAISNLLAGHFQTVGGLQSGPRAWVWTSCSRQRQGYSLKNPGVTFFQPYFGKAQEFQLRAL